MTLVEALAADREGRTRDAAAAYERVLLANSEDLTATMNLAVLYWQATDFGFSAAAGLPSDFIALAGRRLWELLETAQQSFPGRPEATFWHKYISWADLGGTIEPAECRALLRQYPEYLEPAIVLFSRSHGLEAEAEALKILQQCAEAPTARSRYIASVINGVLRRRGWRRTTPTGKAKLSEAQAGYLQAMQDDSAMPPGLRLDGRVLEGPSDAIEALRDKLTMRLAERGFAEDYSTNTEGGIVEDLLDALFQHSEPTELGE